MTIDTLASELKKWLKLAIAIVFLALVAITGIELLGFNVPGTKGFGLDQGTGIALAGIGFLLSKI